jgi:hypothetical protein
MRTIALFIIVLCSLTMTKKLKTQFDSGAANSCNNITLDGSVLMGSCQNIWGQWSRSLLNINPCVGNIDGVLQQGLTKRDYDRTCILCSISNNNLTCTCRKADNINWVTSSLPINSFVGNNNGWLECGNYPN